MGITIKCKKTGNSCDLGYIGFGMFREKIAELYSEKFGNHYKMLSEPKVMIMRWSGNGSKEFYEQYNEITEKMVTSKKLNAKIANFCYQSDCEGSIRYGACKDIYKIIENINSDAVYGYSGRADAATFNSLKALIKECVDNKCDLVWN